MLDGAGQTKEMLAGSMFACRVHQHAFFLACVARFEGSNSTKRCHQTQFAGGQKNMEKPNPRPKVVCVWPSCKEEVRAH